MLFSGISYKARRRWKNFFVALLALVVLLVMIWLLWMLWLDRYVVYTRDGVLLDFDRSSRELFSFTIEEDNYDKKKHLRTITKIGKLYDVALVDFPFYNDTMVEARSLDTRDGFIALVREKQKKELLLELERKELLKRLK